MLHALALGGARVAAGEYPPPPPSWRGALDAAPGLPPALLPGSALWGLVVTASVGSLAAGATSAARMLWERLVKRVVFHADADRSDAPPLLLHGVDCSVYAQMGHPKVLRAAAFAAAAHAGQRRRSGEPYVVHCVETARIVAGLQACAVHHRGRVPPRHGGTHAPTAAGRPLRAVAGCGAASRRGG